MTAFFDIKPEIFFHHIWPQCCFNGLLRMRRVSRYGRLLIDDYLKSNPNLIPELEINEQDDKNLTEFLKMEISLTKVFLNNAHSGIYFYEKWSNSLGDFLDLYGPKITHLRVHALSFLPTEWESKLLCGLVNLESLSASNWITPDSQNDQSDRGSKNLSEDILAVYKRLKNFDVGIDDVHRNPGDADEFLWRVSIHHFRNLQWPSLESLALPSTHFNQEISSLFSYMRGVGYGLDWVPNVLRSSAQVHVQNYYFAWLIETIFMRDSDFQIRPNFSELKQISFRHCHYSHTEAVQLRDEICSLHFGFPSTALPKQDVAPSKCFLVLAASCAKHGIRLEMVNAAWFYAVRTQDNSNVGSTVVSLVDLSPTVINYVDMDNLEQLIISSSRSNVLTMRGNGNDQNRDDRGRFRLAERPNWPLLKSLHLTLGSNIMPKLKEARLREGVQGEIYDDVEYPSHSVSNLFTFLFGDKRFPNLTELTIVFKELLHKTHVINNGTSENIARCCGNVTKLELTNWTGTNLGVTKLWEGLPLLEEVIIRKCRKLGNVGFVGENVNDPIFAKLKNLTKVSLLGLDIMPKLTDTLFRCVLSKMKLSHLNLSSDGPIAGITLDGLRSLLSGPFNESIVKFPFKDWTISGCSPEELAALEKDFRSYHFL